MFAGVGNLDAPDSTSTENADSTVRSEAARARTEAAPAGIEARPPPSQNVFAGVGNLDATPDARKNALYEESIFNWRKAIDLNPRDASAYFRLGCVLARTARFGAAMRCHSEAINIALRTQDTEILRLVGAEFTHISEYFSGAKRRFDAATTIFAGTSPEFIHNNISLSNNKPDGDLEDVASNYSDAAYNAATYFYRGFLLLRTGRVGSAIRLYTKAINNALVSSDTDIQCFIGTEINLLSRYFLGFIDATHGYISYSSPVNFDYTKIIMDDDANSDLNVEAANLGFTFDSALALLRQASEAARANTNRASVKPRPKTDNGNDVHLSPPVATAMAARKFFGEVPPALQIKAHKKSDFPPEWLDDPVALQAARRIVNARNYRKGVGLTPAEEDQVRLAARFVKQAQRRRRARSGGGTSGPAPD